VLLGKLRSIHTT